MIIVVRAGWMDGHNDGRWQPHGDLSLRSFECFRSTGQIRSSERLVPIQPDPLRAPNQGHQRLQSAQGFWIQWGKTLLLSAEIVWGKKTNNKRAPNNICLLPRRTFMIHLVQSFLFLQISAFQHDWCDDDAAILSSAIIPNGKLEGCM